LKEQLPFAHERALDVVLCLKITGHLCLDRGVDHAVERADPFPYDGNVALLYWCNYDVWWRWYGLPSVGFGAADNCYDSGGQQ
jgi:hypothetical protein